MPRRREQPDLCRTCGEPNYPTPMDAKPKRPPVKGECGRCYAYRLTMGKPWTERTKGLNLPPPPCGICGKPSMGLHSALCDICYAYKRRTGKDRNPDLAPLPHVPRPDGTCLHCGCTPKRLALGRCLRCYEYLRTRGIERPLDGSWGKSVIPCVVCSKFHAIRGYGMCASCRDHFPELIPPKAREASS